MGGWKLIEIQYSFVNVMFYLLMYMSSGLFIYIICVVVGRIWYGNVI